MRSPSTSPSSTTLKFENGELVVSSNVMTLPPVCVRCGRLPFGEPIALTYHWHDPLWYATALFGFFPYIVVGAFVRNSHRLVVRLCSEHRRERIVRMLTGYLVIPVLACALCIASAAFGDWGKLLAALCVCGAIAGMWLGSVAERILSVTHISSEASRLRGATPDLLSAQVLDTVSVFE